MSNQNWYPAANERGIVGRFEYLDVLDIPASTAADEERHRKIIVLREKVSASTDDTVRKLRPDNQQAMVNRFPEAWKAFQGEDVPIPGIPLSELGLSENDVLKFKLHAVMTVEQMADLSDASCATVGFGTRKLRDAAKAHLAKAKDAALERVLATAPASVPIVPAKRKPGRPKAVPVELHN